MANRLEEVTVRTEAGQRTKCGLVVDGDPHVLAFTGAALQRAGYSISTAVSASDALKEMLLCPESIDFVIADYDLDGARWSEVVAATRSLYPDARILTTTGCGIGFGSSAIFDDVLEKPFTAVELLERVTAVLDAKCPRVFAYESQRSETPVSAMVVGVGPADYRALARIFALEGWELRRAAGISDAIVQQYSAPARLIVVQNDADEGSWRVLMDRLGWLPFSPRIVVASRLADERLWAEALNLGAFDVVSMPFEAQEIRHVVTHAWISWHDEWATPASAGRTRIAETGDRSDPAPKDVQRERALPGIPRARSHCA